MYLSSKTNWRTFNTYHSTLFKGSVSPIMDLKIGFLFRFSFDKDINYYLGSIKKIHWYKIKSLLPWIFMSTKEPALISSIKEILRCYWGYLFINSDYFSFLFFFFVQNDLAKFVDISGTSILINICQNNPHILINFLRWHLIDFVTWFQTKTSGSPFSRPVSDTRSDLNIIFRTNLEISREITELLLHKCGTPDVVFFSLNNDQRQQIPLI